MSARSSDECALTSPVGERRCPGEDNRVAIVEVPRDHNRVHIRIATYRGRVSELGRYESHGDRHVAFRFRDRGAPDSASTSRPSACRPRFESPWR